MVPSRILSNVLLGFLRVCHLLKHRDFVERGILQLGKQLFLVCDLALWLLPYHRSFSCFFFILQNRSCHAGLRFSSFEFVHFCHALPLPLQEMVLAVLLTLRHQDSSALGADAVTRIV
jgi:hypothetical protein